MEDERIKMNEVVWALEKRNESLEVKHVDMETKAQLNNVRW